MTFIQDSAGVEMVKAGIFEPDKAMWSSDYPHPASSWPNSQPIIEKVMNGMDAGLKKKLLHENAVNLYGLSQVVEKVCFSSEKNPSGPRDVAATNVSLRPLRYAG
jgi:hypothetical protein